MTDAIENIDRTLTEEQAAEYLQLTRRQLAEERRRGRIRHFRILGARVRYTRDHLDEYLHGHPCGGAR